MSKLSPLTTFTPARLVEGKSWYIEYYVQIPGTDQMDRNRIKVNHIKSIVERRKYSKHVISEINTKLYSGWNPYTEATAPKGYTLLSTAIESFLIIKKKELEKASITSYTSFVKRISEWQEKNNLVELFCVNFTEYHATIFMNGIFESPNISPKTFNNYVTFFRALWTWLIDQKYAAHNPFTKIKKKKVQKKSKIRVVIPKDVRERVKVHLEHEDYNYFIVALLVFHCGLRPKEISMLTPRHFRLSKQVIVITEDIAKNDNLRHATIPDALMPYLVQWNFNSAAFDEYIFSKGGLPGKTPIDPREFTRKWDRLRTKLGLPKEMQLYSLRDTGFIQLVRDGIDPIDLMHHADHHSLEQTTEYLNHDNPGGIDAVQKKATEF